MSRNLDEVPDITDTAPIMQKDDYSVYYYSLIIEIIIIMGFQIYIYTKNKNHEELNSNTKRIDDIDAKIRNNAKEGNKLKNQNINFQNTDIEKTNLKSDYIKIENQSEEISNSLELLKKEKDLNYQYLIVYCLARSTIWLKAPYIIVNFMRLDYSITEISVLYFLDLICAFIFGPFLGNYGDIYGRKALSVSYFIFTVIDLGLKIVGNTYGIYFSAVLNGITTVLIHNAFESWVNLEAKLIIPEDNERMVFLKKLFKDAYIYDSICSLACSAISLVLYVRYSIFKL